MREIMNEIVRDKMKVKTKFYLSTIILILLVAFVLVQSADTVAMAGTPDNKGGEVSSQATAGDVPPIEMMPHKSKEELKKKLEKDFKIDGSRPVTLHPNKTFNSVSIAVKNRSKGSGVFKRRELKDFREDEYYVSKAKKFLSKHSGILGIKNLEKNIVVNRLDKRKRLGNSSLSLSLSLSGYLLDGSDIRIGFASDDAIVGATINLPQVTPEMISAVKAAKGKMLSLEELEDVANRNFAKLALDKGWMKNGTVEDYKEFVAGVAEPAPKVRDESPYLVWDFGYTLRTPVEEYSGHSWLMTVDVVTGEIVWGYGGDFSELD